MTTCQSCGKENPPDQDFCSCGEYLRWEPTGLLQAITPEMAATGQSEAPAPPLPDDALPANAARPTPAVQPDGSAPPAAGATPPSDAAAPPNGHAPAPGAAPTAEPLPAVPERRVERTLVQNAAPPAPLPPAEPPQAAPQETATIVLRAPEGEPAKGEVLHHAVAPGERERVLALVRNQSGIVDNYDLRVDGLPDEWYSIFPSTIYLVPFGSGGTYEQEVEIHLHPARTPDAEARVWDLRVVAHSRARTFDAASAPLALHIEPYVDTATTLRPQRRKGRRHADFDVAVTNKANAPIAVALEGTDPDESLRFGFDRAPHEIPAGATVTSRMRVKPPKPLWIGRARDHRLEVKTITGEEAAERAAAAVTPADMLLNAPPPGKKRWFRRRPRTNVPGVYGPRVFKPQLLPPDANIGPGGITIRKPQVRAPQVQGPQLGSINASQLAQKKLPKRGAAAPQGPLLPTQGVFRQKPWIPWWTIPILLLLLLLLLLLYLLLPKHVTVPNLVGAKSSFAAEKTLTNAQLKLDPNQKTRVDDKAAPGTVLQQTPVAGKQVDKNTLVAVLVAVGSGKVQVPKIVGMIAADADKTLRGAKLTLGQASPQPVDPQAKIATQIPTAGETVKAGTPVNIFYPDPSKAAAKKGDKKGAAKKAGGAAAAASAAAAAGAAGGGDIVVPPVDGATLDVYAKKLANLGLVPEVVKQFDDAKPDTVVGTKPEAGTKAANGDKVQVLVSAGQPEVVFSNGKDILLVNGASGKKLDPVAKSPQTESDPTWSADTTHVAYISEGRVYLKDLTKKDAPAVALTPAGTTYENLSWAPTTDANVLAMDKVNGEGDTDLCLGQITKDGLTPQCIDEKSFTVIRAIHWGPDGRSLLAVGVKAPVGGGIFGIVRWHVHKRKPAFSPDPKDWSKGVFETDISSAGKGVLDAAISPDGKHLAMVTNLGSSAFRLWLGKPGDFTMSSGKFTGVRACEVNWRSDSQAVIVIQSDAGCTEEVGSLVRVPTASVKDQKELSAAADDPSFQPIKLGG